MKLNIKIPSPIQTVNLSRWETAGVNIFIKRDDLIHRYIQGNKWRKLKYNLQEAKALGKKQLLTFGGAFSNHIHATAAAGTLYGFETIGIIRGEKSTNLSPTLSFAEAQGMTLQYMDRTTYRQRKDADFLASLALKYPEAYIIPEGGSNALALKGVAEIITEAQSQMHPIPMTWCVGVGSGGTMAGLISAAKETDRVLGFSALKGDFVQEMVQGFLEETQDNWHILEDIHFGGFAKWKPELIDFINDFYASTQIPLDPIYNGKLWHHLDKLILSGYFPKGTTLMVVHSGGLQGIEGFRQRFQVDLLPDYT